MMERTFAIIKPGAVSEGVVGKILSMIEAAGFDILEMHKVMISQEQAEELYVEHKAKPFFGEMVELMTSSPVIILVLSKENAIAAWRDLMGATNPANAAEGTIRKLYGRSMSHNATHGSDSAASAAREIAIFFDDSCCESC